MGAPEPPLPEAFFARPVLTVAQELLGARLVVTSPDGRVVLRLVEVEAYAGPADPASHAWRGPTPRTAVMFGPPGRAYVYRSYGLHWCCNLVTGPDGEASAVLLRAAVPVAGLDVVRWRRPGVAERDLARGPGRLCAAAGISGAHDGTDVTGGGPIEVLPGAPVREAQVRSGPRVGVSRAADRPWRFWVDGDPGVSAYRRAQPRRDGRHRRGV